MNLCDYKLLFFRNINEADLTDIQAIIDGPGMFILIILYMQQRLITVIINK